MLVLIRVSGWGSFRCHSCIFIVAVLVVVTVCKIVVVTVSDGIAVIALALIIMLVFYNHNKISNRGLNNTQVYMLHRVSASLRIESRTAT